jgi:hypothetical protein
MLCFVSSLFAKVFDGMALRSSLYLKWDMSSKFVLKQEYRTVLPLNPTYFIIHLDTS